MEGLLRHAVIASGIELSRHQYDAAAVKDIAEKSVKLVHRHYVLLYLKLVVRLDLMIAFMAVYLGRTTNGVSYAIYILIIHESLSQISKYERFDDSYQR